MATIPTDIVDIRWANYLVRSARVAVRDCWEFPRMWCFVKQQLSLLSNCSITRQLK